MNKIAKDDADFNPSISMITLSVASLNTSLTSLNANLTLVNIAYIKAIFTYMISIKSHFKQEIGYDKMKNTNIYHANSKGKKIGVVINNI